MLIDHLGKGKDRGGRSQCHEEPDRAEEDRPSRRPTACVENRASQKGGRRERAGDDTRVVPVRDRRKVRVGGQPERQEKEAKVVQPGEHLGLQVRQRGRGSPDHAGSAQARLEQIEAASREECRKDQHEEGPALRFRPGPHGDGALLRKHQQVCRQHGREHDRGLLGEGPGHGRHEPDEAAPRARQALVQDERADHPERRKDLRAQRQEVHRLAVGPMQAEERGSEEREQAPRRRQPGERQDTFEEEVHENAQSQVEAPLRHMEGKRVDASPQPVVQREGRAGQRPVRGVGGIARKGRRVAEEERNVVQASQIRIVLNDGPVVEVERIAEVVGVSGEHDADRDDGENEEGSAFRVPDVRDGRVPAGSGAGFSSHRLLKPPRPASIAALRPAPRSSARGS